MPCDEDGCDIHDYPIASPWCEYKWHLERTARASENTDKTVRKLTQAVNLMADMLEFGMLEDYVKFRQVFFVNLDAYLSDSISDEFYKTQERFKNNRYGQ